MTILERAAEYVEINNIPEEQKENVADAWASGFETGQKEKFIAEYLNKKIAGLEWMIDQMKLCGNCKHCPDEYIHNQECNRCKRCNSYNDNTEDRWELLVT